MSEDTEQAIVRATNEAAEEAWERYGEKWALQALVTAIPYLGGPLDAWLKSKGSEITRKRIMGLFEELKKQTEEIDKKKINKDFFNTEEFFDLAIMAMDAAARTRSREKVKIYARVLLGAATTWPQPDHDPETYLSILSEITPTELEILKALYRVQKDGPPKDVHITKWEQQNGWKRILSGFDLPEEEVRLYLQRLERTGLVTSITGYLDTLDAEGHFIISGLFRKLATFLEM